MLLLCLPCISLGCPAVIALPLDCCWRCCCASAYLPPTKPCVAIIYLKASSSTINAAQCCQSDVTPCWRYWCGSSSCAHHASCINEAVLLKVVISPSEAGRATLYVQQLLLLLLQQLLKPRGTAMRVRSVPLGVPHPEPQSAAPTTRPGSPALLHHPHQPRPFHQSGCRK